MKILKKQKSKKIIISFALILSMLTYPSIGFAKELPADVPILTSNSQDIDTGIGNLQYDKQAVLASKGDTVESFVPKEGHLLGDKFVVVERSKKSLTSTPVDISIIDSVTDRTYPGAIQLANSDFVENRPTLLTAKRKPINITIDLPGMGKANTVTVENPTYGNILGEIDSLIDLWDAKYSNTHTLPARTQYSEAMVYSQSQIANALNVNLKVLDSALNIDFNAVNKGEKKIMIAAYKQIFYNVSAELPNKPSDLFDDSVTFDDLRYKGVSNEAPPVMVSNVAYGRTIYVKMETTAKSNDVEAAFKALTNGQGGDASSKYKDIYDQSSFTAVVLGGDSSEHNKIITKDFNEILNVIKNNSKFSIQNPGYPISYTSTFIKDNSLATVHNRTEYVETKSTEHTKGKINLDHSGAYVAQFNITWDEVSYDEMGNEILIHKSWSQNGYNKTAHYSTVIPLPANAKNINIFAKECSGLAWDWWRTVVDETNVPLSDIIVSIGGTTLYPTANVTYK